MDTKSTLTRESRSTASELDKFQLFYEFVPVQKPSKRIKRSDASKQ